VTRALFALAALVLALAGCGRTTSVREPDLVVRGDQAVPARPSPDQQSRGLRITSTRIAVITHGQASDPIWAVVKRGLEDAGRRQNVAVSYRAPDTYDIERMREMLQQAIADRPDGLVVSLPDASVLGSSIREAGRAGIPVVTINSGSDEFRQFGVQIHVGQPEYEAGVRGGERMAAAGVLHALCVSHESGNHGLSERCRGFAKGLASRGGTSNTLAIDLQDPMGAQRAIAQAIGGGDVDGIMTLGAAGAAPALAALRASGFEDRVKLATFDLSNDVLRAIEDKRILFAIDQQPYLEGYLPIVLLAERARHGIFPAAGGLIPTGPRFVTPANVADVIRQSRDGVR
jgi:simple sugar transport system substrate-binding protein